MKKEKRSELTDKILDNIKALRAIGNYSQQNIAEKLGCDYSTYGKIESGKSGLSVTRLFQLAEIFNVDPSALIYGYESGAKKSDAPKAIQGYESKINIQVSLMDEPEIAHIVKDFLSKTFAK